MLPWLSTSIFKRCAKGVSCFQYCLEFISYFPCKRALTCVSLPYLGSPPRTGRRKKIQSLHSQPPNFFLVRTPLCQWPEVFSNYGLIARHLGWLQVKSNPLINDTQYSITVVQWYHLIPWHADVKETARMGDSSEIPERFSTLWTHRAFYYFLFI